MEPVHLNENRASLGLTPFFGISIITKMGKKGIVFLIFVSFLLFQCAPREAILPPSEAQKIFHTLWKNKGGVPDLAAYGRFFYKGREKIFKGKVIYRKKKGKESLRLEGPLGVELLWIERRGGEIFNFEGEKIQVPFDLKLFSVLFDTLLPPSFQLKKSRRKSEYYLFDARYDEREISFKFDSTGKLNEVSVRKEGEKYLLLDKSQKRSYFFPEKIIYFGRWGELRVKFNKIEEER